MLKRSFAEFHAQRAAPEAREALAAGEAALAALRARPWPASRRGTGRAEVERYVALTRRVEALGALLQVRLPRTGAGGRCCGRAMLAACPGAGRARGCPAGSGRVRVDWGAV
jgi:hypothetical protein